MIPPVLRIGFCLIFVLGLVGGALSNIKENDRCLYRRQLTLGRSAQINLNSLFPSSADASPCLPALTASKGAWYSILGDGTNYTYTICSPSTLLPKLAVYVHIDNDCRMGYDCMKRACSQLECVATFSLEDTADYCRTGVTWQTVSGREYQILISTDASDTADDLLEVAVNSYTCDGVNNGHVFDQCGTCNGDDTGCGLRGCDGVLGSNKSIDVCGVCGGRNDSCPTGCDQKPFSNKQFDACNVCDGDGKSCLDCHGNPQPDPALRAAFDACNVCGGNNSTCKDCLGVPNGDMLPDVCGVCFGNGSTCLDCAGCPFGNATLDDCGECNGNNSCYGCDKVKNSGAKLDICGECNGNGSTCSVPCNASIPFSVYDACHVCNGDNSTCNCTYDGFGVPEMDCRLMRSSLASIVTQIDTLIGTLLAIRNSTLLASELQRGVRPHLTDELIESNQFTRTCVNPYAASLNAFIADGLAPVIGVA